MVCRSCGEERDLGSQFCPWCFALSSPEVVEREPVLVAAVVAEPMEAQAQAQQPDPQSRPVPPLYMQPNPFERPACLPAPVVTRRRPASRLAGVSWGKVAGVVALVFVVLAGAVVATRQGEPTVAVASLPMATDDEVKAAMADVVAAQAAHFKAKGSYSAAPSDLRASAAKAPVRNGHAPDAGGAVYVDVPVASAGAEPTFYLAARKPSGGGCLYVKGVPDGTSEATRADCTSGLAVDFRPSPQSRRAQAMMLTVADLGSGWTVDPDNEDATPLWDDKYVTDCLGAQVPPPPGSAPGVAFERGDSLVIANTAVWLTDDAARSSAALVDHPKMGTCMADDLRAGFAGGPRSLVEGAHLTVTDRGALAPGRDDVRRIRFRLDLAGNGAAVTVWADAVIAVRGRTEAALTRITIGAPADAASTLRWIDLMLARGQQ